MIKLQLKVTIIAETFEQADSFVQAIKSVAALRRASTGVQVLVDDAELQGMQQFHSLREEAVVKFGDDR